jgi:prolyl 4-hydroxylase
MESILATSKTEASIPLQIPEVGGFCIVLDNILTEKECQDCISISEAKGFAVASLHTDLDGVEHYSSIRKSKRCIIDCQEFADRLWERIQNAVPKEWNGLHLHFAENASPVNKRLRFLKYDTPGDEFKPHSDGQYRASDGSISIFTVLIYLNTEYEGAFTHFLCSDQSDWIAVQPLVGRVAIQDQQLIHCVPSLKNGCKYAIRTEIMYKYNLEDGSKKNSESKKIIHME